MNAILFTKGTWGDIVPFLAIGRALKRRGHSVTLVTHSSHKTLGVSAGLDFVAVDTQEEFASFLTDLHLLHTPKGVPEFFRRHCLNRVEREYRLLLSLASKPQSIFIARYMSGLADLLAQEHTGVPIARIYLCVAHLRARFLLKELCQTILRQDILRSRTELGFGLIPNDPDWPCVATVHLAAWPEWYFAISPQWPSNSFAVGFLIDDETESGPVLGEAETILGNDRDSILVTGGTSLSSSNQFYDSVLRACASRSHRVLVTGHQPDQFMANLPINIRWFPFLPFANVMPRVAAVVHPAGIGTAARALADGVPQLLLPYGGDQPDNAARFEALGVGRKLLPTQWRSDAIIQMLDEVLYSPKIRDRCQAFSQIVRREKPGESAAETIEQVLLHSLR